MKLLLVDDEKYVIESIKKNLDLENCGIKEVYTAFSMKQAQKIMELMPVDIIISDIVMPEESGFDFVNWVRKKEYDVQVIFLTSYAEFDYAKRAIALNSVDYLLKPIVFEQLEKTLSLAVKKVEESRKYQNYRNESRHWRQNQEVFKVVFWKEVLSGTITAETFYREAQKRRLSYTKESQTMILYLIFSEKNKSREIWDEKILHFIVGNVLNEMLEKRDAVVEAVVPSDSEVCAVIRPREETGEKDVLDHVSVIFDEFVIWLHEKLHLDIWCGAGNVEEAANLKKSVECVKKMREDSLSVWNQVLYLSDFRQPEIGYQNSDIGVWMALLEENKEQELIDSMEKYLRRIEKNEMITREILKSFRMDVVQIVYSWLARKEVKAHLLFAEKEHEVYYQKALESVQGAMEYARSLVSKAISYQIYSNKTESVTEQIRQYIDTHYQEDIRREDLAKKVYLNTDYLSRIFKKEAGVSISTYILQKRVEEAKKLLSQTNLPINTVSIYVGYSNFSYFTKMFKENTGCSPLEYRRKCREIRPQDTK